MKITNAMLRKLIRESISYMLFESKKLSLKKDKNPFKRPPKKGITISRKEPLTLDKKRDLKRDFYEKNPFKLPPKEGIPLTLDKKPSKLSLKKNPFKRPPKPGIRYQPRKNNPIDDALKLTIKLTQNNNLKNFLATGEENLSKEERDNAISLMAQLYGPLAEDQYYESGYNNNSNPVHLRQPTGELLQLRNLIFEKIPAKYNYDFKAIPLESIALVGEEPNEDQKDALMSVGGVHVDAMKDEAQIMGSIRTNNFQLLYVVARVYNITDPTPGVFVFA